MDPTTFAALVAQQKGTPVMVNIWASWCTPCAAEAPDLIAAHRVYGDKVRFIGVDAQDDRSGATDFIASHQVPYPSVFDPSNQIAVSYGLFSPPDTLFFDAERDPRQDDPRADLPRRPRWRTCRPSRG